VKTQFSILKTGKETGKARRAAARPGFTLVEMMVTVGLLAFIVVGLTTMFVQAQRAFRAGMNQTDVLETGRAMTDLLTHQLEEAVPSGQGGLTNFSITMQDWSTNTMVGGSPARTNVIDSVYFLSHSNLTTILNGYVVALTNAALSSAHFGTLYYYQTDIYQSNNPSWVYSNMIYTNIVLFQNIASNAVHDSFINITNNNNIDPSLIRVADGVVHFRVLAYDTSGDQVMTGNINTNVLYTNALNTVRSTVTNGLPYGETTLCTFSSNAVPASVDLELGVLESSTLATLTAMPPGFIQQRYLTNSETTGRIHLFRRHITLSGVNPEAYQ